MKKVLVTGGMGFIGGHLVKKLLDAGMEVVIIDRAPYKPVPFDTSRVKIIETDMMSLEYLKSALEGVDVCFHLAAISSLAQCHYDWIYALKNNVLCFNNLLDILMRQFPTTKLVYASSSSVYGNCEILPLTEKSTTKPTSSYGADKLTNELYASIACQCYGYPSIGLRLFNVYGIGQPESSPYSGVITQFTYNIEQNEPLIIFGDGEQSRDFIPVEEVTDAFILAAQKKHDSAAIYNVCSGRATTINYLAEVMLDLSNKSLPVIHEKPRTGDLIHSLGSGKLAQKELRFSSAIGCTNSRNIALTR